MQKMKTKATVALLFYLFTFLPFKAQMRINFSGDSPLRKLQIAEMAINNLYVDTVDEDKLVEDAIRGMLEKLDPHSSYSDPEEVKAMNEPLQGNFEGIGVQFNMVDDTLLVIQPVSKGPSEKVGIMAGDRIVSVNDTAVAGVKMAREEIMRRLRGPKGTKVVLRVIPASDKSGSRTKLVDLVRDEVKLEEQAVTGRVERLSLPAGGERRLGYVRIPTFYAGMAAGAAGAGGAEARSMTRDLLRYVQDFNQAHVEGLVIDLRNNGGGSLAEALAMTGLFVTGPAVQVRDRARVQTLNAQGRVAFRKPLLVLVNRNSASASEIVASALQDYGRALVVGDSKTHGKGTVQTVLGLGDNQVYGADRVTSACFFRINGGTTQLRGVVPDLVLPSIYDALDLGEDQLPGALPYAEIPPAYYAKTEDVAPYLPRLKAASDARLAADAQYQASQSLIAHVRRANAEQTVPLNIDKRRERMRAERAMEKLQEDALRGGSAKDRKEGPTPENDPVLRESLRILSDYIDLRGGPDAPVDTDGDLGLRLFRLFGAQ